MGKNSLPTYLSPTFVPGRKLAKNPSLGDNNEIRNSPFSHPILSSVPYFLCCVSETLRVAFKCLLTTSCLYFTLPVPWIGFFSLLLKSHSLTQSQIKNSTLTGTFLSTQPEIVSPSFDLWFHILPRPLFGQLNHHCCFLSVVQNHLRVTCWCVLSLQLFCRLSTARNSSCFLVPFIVSCIL